VYCFDTFDIVFQTKELWGPYNAYAEKFNADNRTEIEIGELAAKPLSSAEFYWKKLLVFVQPFTLNIKDGILDIT